MAAFFTHPELLGNLESIAKILAMGVAAWWTWSLFVRQRQKYPRATVTHTLSYARLSDRLLVQIAVEVKNIGTTIIRRCDVDLRLQHIGPFSQDELNRITAGHPALGEAAPAQVGWPMIARRVVKVPPGEREIEPGESAVLHFDFVIDDKTDRARVYSHIQNRAKRRLWKRWRFVNHDIGWTAATIHPLREEKKMTDDRFALAEQSLPEPPPAPWIVPQPVPPPARKEKQQAVPEPLPERRPPAEPQPAEEE
jgi:hypothetical protein